MTFIRTLTTLLFTLLLLAANGQAETSIWKISSGSNSHYLAGTFHLLKPSDYPLPKEFDQAYNQVNWLVFETDLEQIEHPSFQQKFLASMRLPTGKILADKLSPKAYAELIRYAAKNNLDIGGWQHLKPQMVSLIISLQELKKLGLTAKGVDSYMAEKAQRDGKVTSHLESVEKQIHFISSMSENNESALILQTLDDIKKLSEDLESISNAWRLGDREQLYQAGLKPMMENYPMVYQSLLVERNNNWLPKIEKLMTEDESKLILVGALHLIGEEGLLEQLRKRGYTIEQF